MKKDELNKYFGTEFKRQRKLHKLTQQELADRVGISRSVLARYESGTIEISMTMFVAICDALNVPYAEVLEGVSYE